MLYSQGVTLEELGVPRGDGGPVETDPRKIWRRFAEHYRLFRGTPTRLWLDHAFETCSASASGSRPTTPTALRRHRDACGGPNSGRARCSSGSTSRSSPPPKARSTICAGTGRSAMRLARPRGHDLSAGAVVDPDFPGFRETSRELGEITGEDTRLGRAISRRIASAALSSRPWARPPPITATRAPRPPTSRPARRRRCSRRVLAEADDRRRRRAVPRADADRDGGDEPRRRAGDADPSRLVPQPQPASSRRSAATRAPTSRRRPTTCTR